MSKYYKAEDVIRKRAEDLADTSYWEWGNPKNVDDWIEVVEMEFTDLPTIEVSEDCISRSALISFIDAGHLRNPSEKCYSENDVVELIKNAPSVVLRLDKEDLEDIYEHISESYVEGYMDGHAEGEWINQEQGAFYPVECSNCHKQPLFNEDEDYEYTKYCPYCGAKMKG